MTTRLRTFSLEVLDPVQTLRRLASGWTLLLVLLGAAAGLLADRVQGSRHTVALEWGLPPIDCAGEAFRPGAFAKSFSLSAGFTEGHHVDADLAPRLRESLFRCDVSEESTGAHVRCLVDASEEIEALRLASLARDQVRNPTSPFSLAQADGRIAATCGGEYLRALKVEAGESDPRLLGQAGADSRLGALRSRLARGVSLKEASPPESRPVSRSGPVTGAIAGVFASLLLAAWRSRRQPAPSDGTEPGGLAATVALAALLLTAAMDTVLVVDVGPFTLRAAHFFALARFSVLAVSHFRSRRTLEIPAAPLLAGLLYLTIAALTALRSANPVKSVGYLAWASFDLGVVLAGLSVFARTPDRLRKALRFWVGGMVLAAAMGGLQILLWKLTGKAPLLTTTADTAFPRINGFNYEPSYFALYLVPGGLVLLTRFALLGTRAWRSGVLGGLLLLAVGLSTARSGWLGVSIGAVLLLTRGCMLLGRRGLVRAGIGAAGAALVFGSVLVAWPAMRTHVVGLARKALDRHENTSSKPRLENLHQALVLFSRHPVAGVGFAGYGGYVMAHPELPQPVENDAHSVVTMNLYLETLAETGLAGFLAALLLLGTLLWPLAKSLRQSRERLPSEEAAATREGMMLACLVVFGVLFQFSQTLWRLDVWVMLSLAYAAGRLALIENSMPKPPTEPSEQ